MSLFFHHNQLEKHLDFFDEFRPKGRANLRIWLLTSFLAVGLTIVGLIIWTSHLGVKRLILEKEVAALQQKYQKQKCAVCKLKTFSAIDKKLRQKMARCEYDAKICGSFADALIVMAGVIPNNTKLEKITFAWRESPTVVPGDKKSLVRGKNRLIYEGCSCDEREIMMFHQALQQRESLIKSRVRHLQLVNEDVCKFTIEGGLKVA